MDNPRLTVGAISERTLANVRRATAWGAQIKQVSIVWKFWTDQTRWKPEYYDSIVDWWERESPISPIHVATYKVRWIKIYWLRFGFSLYWRLDSDPHERMNHVT